MAVQSPPRLNISEFATLLMAATRSGPPSPASARIKTTTVYESSSGSCIGRLATRPNGGLLFGCLDSPQLYSVDGSRRSDPNLIYTFPEASGIVAIARANPKRDEYALVTGRWDTATGAVELGSFTVWTITLRDSIREPPIIRQVAHMPESTLLSDIAYVDSDSTKLLVSDSANGVIWGVNAQSGEYGVVLADTTMRPERGQLFGINGVRVVGGFVYYTNTSRGLLCRMAVDMHDQFCARGPAQIISRRVRGASGLAIGSNGIAYVAGNQAQVLYSVNVAMGVVDVLLEEEQALMAVEFADGTGEQALWMSCGGNLPGRGGRIVRVEL